MRAGKVSLAGARTGYGVILTFDLDVHAECGCGCWDAGGRWGPSVDVSASDAYRARLRAERAADGGPRDRNLASYDVIDHSYGAGPSRIDWS